MKRLGFVLMLLAFFAGVSAQTSDDGEKKDYEIVPDSVVERFLETVQAKDSVQVSDSIAEEKTLQVPDSIAKAEAVQIPDSVEKATVVHVPDSVIFLDSIPGRGDVPFPDTLRIAAQRDSLERVEKLKKVKKVILPSPQMIRFRQLVADFRRDYDEALERWDDIYLIIRGIRPDPDFFKLYVPATYYSAAVEQAFGIEGWKPVNPFVKEDPRLSLQSPVKNLCRTADVDRYVNRQLLSFYVEYPELVAKNEMNFADLKPLLGEKRVNENNEKTIKELMKKPRLPNKMVQKDLLVYKPNFWTLTGNGYLQFSQNYISGNWYKGGESTKSLLSGFTFQANYDDRQKIQFENRLEWKLGFITSPSDTVHSYKPNNDLLRFTTKFGYKAFNSWYYTLSAEFKTQLFSNYETNSETLNSGFFTPAELNVGLGMDYKFIKDGVCNLSVLINPVNYTLYSIASDKVDPTKFNIKEGHKKESVWGSRIESTWKWQIIPVLIWESRLSYTTNYEKVLAEWENTFTFTVNQYLSTKFFVHGRFDDGVTREVGDSYFQLQELLSFGLSYTW